MKIQLLLDEDIHFALADALRKRGYDVVHAQELQRKGRSDVEQLHLAVEQERCLFSFNVKDFVLLHNDKMSSAEGHSGIIVSKQLPLRETLSRLLKLLRYYSKEDIQNRLQFL